MPISSFYGPIYGVPKDRESVKGHTEDGDDNDGESSSNDDEVFGLPEPYVEVCTLGKGGYGVVTLAKDAVRNSLVAVKRLATPFLNFERAKFCFRELHLLNCLRHPNVVEILDAFLDEDGENLYLVTNYVHNDLRTILESGELFPLDRIRSIMYQMLQVLDYMHKRAVIHRDLKPENILLTDDYRLKICDLGLARETDTETDMTGYLATRYYRAPEFMLTWRNYGSAVDIWSAGCVFAELATGRLLFPGMDHIHHLKLIMELVGSPSESVLARICSSSTMQYLSMLPYYPRADFQTLFGERLGREGADLLCKMLELDPNHRILSTQALLDPFFSELNTSEVHEYPMAIPSTACHGIGVGTGDSDWPQLLLQELDYYNNRRAKKIF